MKTYNKSNFFKHTYCEFQEISLEVFNKNTTHYKSKSDSLYHYTQKGVYRYSNHWGRVANCRWKLIANNKFKNQEYHLGFATWMSFCPLNDTSKLFFIEMDFNKNKVDYQHVKLSDKKNLQLFTTLEAQKKVRQIRKLLKETQWAKYFKQDIKTTRKLIITSLINSTKNIQEIKKEVLNN